MSERHKSNSKRAQTHATNLVPKAHPYVSEEVKKIFFGGDIIY